MKTIQILFEGKISDERAAQIMQEEYSTKIKDIPLIQIQDKNTKETTLLNITKVEIIDDEYILGRKVKL